MKQSKRGRRNFWGDWRKERRRYCGPGQAGAGPGPWGPPTEEMRRAWRDFFHEFTGAWPEGHWAFHGRRFRPWHQGMDAFNPFVANLLSQGGGLLPLIVLQLLDEQPRYANQIMSLISERTAGQWIANPGAVYPLLNEMEERGLVTGEWDDPRKRTVRLYRLTDFGRQEMARVGSIIRPKLEEALQVMRDLVAGLPGQVARERTQKNQKEE